MVTNSARGSRGVPDGGNVCRSMLFVKGPVLILPPSLLPQKKSSTVLSLKSNFHLVSSAAHTCRPFRSLSASTSSHPEPLIMSDFKDQMAKKVQAAARGYIARKVTSAVAPARCGGPIKERPRLFYFSRTKTMSGREEASSETATYSLTPPQTSK